MKTEEGINEMGTLPAPDGLSCTGRAGVSVLPQAPLLAAIMLWPRVTPLRLVTPHPGDTTVALGCLSHPEPIT